MTRCKKILIVDDNDFILHYLETIIANDRQYEVICAQSGEGALKEIEQNHFDLVISDILMPKMNGIEFIEKLR